MVSEKSIRIERLPPSRLDDLIVAQNDIFSDYIIHIRSSRQFFLEFLRSVGGDLANVLVAMDGDVIVGYINPVIDGDEGWIGGLGVIPAYRSRGIATMLMAAAEDMCGKRAVKTVLLEVIEGNMRAQRLYQQLGYKVVRKYLSAEGRPSKFEGYGQEPEHAGLAEVLALHERSYKDTCWQRRKTEALVQSAKDAENFKVDGGFAVIRSIDTNGFIPFLGVVPEKRGKGIGTALAKFALTKLHDSGAFKVAVYNVNEDLPTMRLLDQFDFKVTMKQIEMVKHLGRGFEPSNQGQ